MIVKRSDITTAALGHLGTPWQHMGRTRAGVDCVGLVISIWDELKFTPAVDLPPYRAQPDGSMLQYFKRYMKPCSTRRLKPGTVVVYAFQGSPYHVGVVIDAKRKSIVHALAGSRKVVLDIVDHSKRSRKLLCAWDYPEVIDG